MYEYNPQTGQWEDPEERRKREAEQAKALGTTEVGKREIVTYADGSQTHKTTQEIPNPGFFDRLGTAFQQAGSNFVNNATQGFTNLQNAPQNFVNSVSNLGQQSRVQPQPTQTPQQQYMAAPIAPEMPPVDYGLATQQGGPGLRYGQAFAPQQTQQPIAQPAVPGQPQTQPAPTYDRAAAVAQRESNGNFDIGYHFPEDANGKRKSTAYGGFGITAPAYQDIQKADPYFANRPITSLNRDDQTRAFNTLSNLNAQRLQRAGVEPTPQNLDLAHFFGAGGAANYLKNGYISPQAAGANGGADKVRAVADKILSGGQVAVSGAAEQGAVAQPAPQATEAAVTPVQAGITAYQNVQDDPMALLRLRNDQNQPEFIRQRSANRAYELMDAEVKQRQAQDMMPKLNAQEVSRALTKRSEGNTVGDWLQYLLFKHVGLTDLANEKGEQLGIGSKWLGAQDQLGNAGMIKYTASGMPLEGVKADGTTMTKTELAAYASQGAALKGVNQSNDVYKDPSGKVKGSFVLETRDGRTPVYKEVGTGRQATAAESAVLNKVGVAGTLEQQAAAQQQKLGIRLQYEPAIAAATKGASTLAEFNAMNGTNFAIAGRDAQGVPLLVDQTTGQLLMKPQAGTQAAPGAPTAAGTAVPAGPTPADIQRQGKTQEAQTAAFVKFENEDLLPRAEAGQTIARVRKEQIKGPDGILNNPEIASLLQGSSGGEVGNIIRDLITGGYANQADLSARVASLNLNDRQKAVLYRQIGLNNQIAPLTLRANAGPGAVSDAEQKANRDANVDITRQPLYSGLSLLTKDQYMKDLMQARADYRTKNPQLATTAEFNTAWNAEKARLDKQYDSIYAARAAYIAKYNPMDANGKATNPGAVVDAYKLLPVPEWNGETRTWDYGTPQAEAIAKKASRKPLNSFNK